MNGQAQNQQDPSLGWPNDADATSPADPIATARDWNPNIKPALALERGTRKKGGMVVLLIALLFVALIAGGAWYFLKGHSTAKRLPGSWSMEPTRTTAAKTTTAKSPAAKKPTTSPAAPAAQAAKPASEAQAGIEAPTASPLPQIASLGALPAGAASDAARLPLPQATASSAESRALPSPISTPTAQSAIEAEKMIDMEQRLDRLQDSVAALQTRLDANEAQNRRAPSPAATHAAAQQRSRRERLASRRQEEPASAAVESAPPPTLGAQLLSVDMWAGAPSVVVTSGLAGDTRTRTLRPGDTLNGVTLQSADPATGSATFKSGGKTFTLSTRDGG